jgi:hypothetical protein
MMPDARGKTVAIVGRAASLIGSGNGAAIDACEYVVRVNWMVPPKGDPKDVGTRTDLVYYCRGCHGQKDAADAAGVPRRRVDKKLRKRISRNPDKVRPTTGVVAIFDALRSGARRVHAFGFDFYRSAYAAPAPPWMGDPTTIKEWVHDPTEDRRLLKTLLQSERRFRPDPTLRRALCA